MQLEFRRAWVRGLEEARWRKVKRIWLGRIRGSSWGWGSLTLAMRSALA